MYVSASARTCVCDMVYVYQLCVCAVLGICVSVVCVCAHARMNKSHQTTLAVDTIKYLAFVKNVL